MPFPPVIQDRNLDRPTDREDIWRRAKSPVPAEDRILDIYSPMNIQ
jgi:hypothetical protein